MSTTTITFTVKVGAVLTDVTSIVFADPTDAFGVRRTDTNDTVVAADTALTHASTGVYQYTIDDPAPNLTYEAWFTFVYSGATYKQQQFYAGGTSSASSLTLSDLQTRARYAARNAGDSTAYPDEQIDIALQDAAEEWRRLTMTPRRLDTVNLSIGNATVTGFPDNFLPEWLIEAYLTLSGKIIGPAISVATIENALTRQTDGSISCSTTPPTAPPTGRPTTMAFQSQSVAILDRLPDLAYSLDLWWVDSLTTWDPGSGSSSLTFNLPDDALRVIATAGAAYYLQRMEPSNAARAEAAHAQFTLEALRFKARNAGGRGAKTIQRSSPYDSTGNWVRGNR